jgi:AcrR family transcriptional regulator
MSSDPGLREDSQTSGHEARWEQHNSERRSRILRAAVELIEEAPAGTDVSVRQISARAGLAKSVVYRQFEGREDLDRRIRSHLIDDFSRTLEAGLDTSHGSIEDIIARTIRAVADWMADHPRLDEFARTGPTHEGPSDVDAVTSLKLRMSERARDVLTSIADQLGVDTGDGIFDTLPFAVVTMVEGTLTHWVHDVDPTRTREQIVGELTTLTRYVLDGAIRSVGLSVDPRMELTDLIAQLSTR